MKSSRNTKPLTAACRRCSEDANGSNSSGGSSAEKTTTRSNMKEGRHGKSKKDSSRRATFRDKIHGRVIKSHRNFSKKEHKNTWISDEDEEASQAHMIETVRTIRKKIRRGQPIPSSLNDNDDLCVRGLEKMHTAQSDQVAQNRKKAVRYAVFAEQQLQQQRVKHDPKRIARASMANSSESMDLAISQAAKDAAYVNLHVRDRPSTRRSLEHAQQQRNPGAGMNGIEISFLNLNISGSNEEESQSNRSLLSSPTNPNQPRRRDSSLTTLEQPNQSLLSSPTNPNQSSRRRDSSLTTMDESASAVISNHSSLTNPNEQFLRSVETPVIATDSVSTLGSRRSTESRTLIRQGRGLYRPRNDPNDRSPHMLNESK